MPSILRKRPRRLAALLAVALGGLAAIPAAATAAQEDFYGINSGGDIWSLPAAARDAQLAMMRGIGLSVVRTDASWAGAEPKAPQDGVHTYVWRGFDEKVAAMARHGLRWYPMLGYSTAWSGTTPGDMFSGPANPADYAAFARAFVERYGRGGTFWHERPELPALPTTTVELWNEPNFDHFWRDQTNAPAQYADLYATARDAIKQVDPAVTAVVGGLIDSDNASDFVRQMYSHRPSLRGNVDALGFHPYAQPGGPVATVRSMRRTLDRLGEKRVPIEITEIGWFAGAMTEAQRARTLRLVARRLKRSNLNVTRFIPYVWTGGAYALWHGDATPTLSGVGYTEAVRAVTGPQGNTVGTAAVKRMKVRGAAARRKARKARKARATDRDRRSPRRATGRRAP